MQTISRSEQFTKTLHYWCIFWLHFPLSTLGKYHDLHCCVDGNRHCRSGVARLRAGLSPLNWQEATNTTLVGRGCSLLLWKPESSGSTQVRATGLWEQSADRKPWNSAIEFSTGWQADSYPVQLSMTAGRCRKGASALFKVEVLSLLPVGRCQLPDVLCSLLSKTELCRCCNYEPVNPGNPDLVTCGFLFLCS
jgi:hypothetical protein